MESPGIIGNDIVLEMSIVRIGTVEVAILGGCRAELLNFKECTWTTEGSDHDRR